MFFGSNEHLQAHNYNKWLAERPTDWQITLTDRPSDTIQINTNDHPPLFTCFNPTLLRLAQPIPNAHQAEPKQIPPPALATDSKRALAPKANTPDPVAGGSLNNLPLARRQEEGPEPVVLREFCQIALKHHLFSFASPHLVVEIRYQPAQRLAALWVSRAQNLLAPVSQAFRILAPRPGKELRFGVHHVLLAARVAYPAHREHCRVVLAQLAKWVGGAVEE